MMSAPSFTPTAAPSTKADDDDEFEVNSAVVDLEWSDIWNILIPSLLAAVALVAFTVSRLRKRSSFHLIYCPRYRWEREVAELSKKGGGNYEPLQRPNRQRGSLFDWLGLVVHISDSTLLRHTGLEMYMMLRFIRLCVRITVFGSAVIVPISIGAYATATSTDDEGGSYSNVAFYRFTLANVDSENKGRLWTTALLMCLVTLHVHWVVWKECVAFVELKQNFFTRIQPASDPIASSQQLRSIMLERLPPCLRTSESLFNHWNSLLPDRVHSATVCVDTRPLFETAKSRQEAVKKLERHLLKKERMRVAQEVEGDGRSRGDCGACPRSSCCEAEDENEAERRQRKIQKGLKRLSVLNEEYRRKCESILAESETRRAAAEVDEDDRESVEEKVNRATRKRSSDNEGKKTLLARLVHSTSRVGAEATAVLEGASIDDAARSTRNVVASAARLAKRVTVGEEFCDTGFVTFTDFTSANMVKQMQLSEQPHDVECKNVVADARDIIWENVCESLSTQHAKMYTGSLLVYLLAFYWSFFIAFCYAIANKETLRELGILPAFSKLNSSEKAVINYMLSVLPIALISGALALFPILLEQLAVNYERRKLRSEVQLSVLQRNFFLQIINLWLTLFAGSVWNALESILKNPGKFFTFIGKTLPVVSVYFVELIVIKTFISLFWELARMFPWVRLRANTIAGGGALTERDRRDSRFMRPEMPYGNIYSTILMVLTFSMLFAVIAPLCYIFSLVFFLLAYLVYTHQALHVYIPFYDSGGIFFFSTYSYLHYALIASQFTVFGFLLVKQAWFQAGLTFFLPISTYIFNSYITLEFTSPSERPSLQRILARDADSSRRRTNLSDEELVSRFDPNFYRQPELDESDLQPLPATRLFTDADEDAPFDDAGNEEDSDTTPTADTMLLHEDDRSNRQLLDETPLVDEAQQAQKSGPYGSVM